MLQRPSLPGRQPGAFTQGGAGHRHQLPDWHRPSSPSALEPQGVPAHELLHQTVMKKQTRLPLPPCTSPVGSFQSLWVYLNENNMKTWADSFLSKRKNLEQ